MADVLSSRKFLSETASQKGIFVFMNYTDKLEWHVEGSRFDRSRNEYRGPQGSTILLVVWVDDRSLERMVEGQKFDRFWSEGEMPRSVGESVLRFCK